MAELSPVFQGVASKNQSVVLQHLAKVGQVRVGEFIGRSESWVCRWKQDDLESCAALLAAVGLKLVPVDNKCYPVEYIDHLRYFAEIGMAHGQPPTLDWSDAQ